MALIGMSRTHTHTHYITNHYKCSRTLLTHKQTHANRTDTRKTTGVYVHFLENGNILSHAVSSSHPQSYNSSDPSALGHSTSTSGLQLIAYHWVEHSLVAFLVGDPCSYIRCGLKGEDIFGYSLKVCSLPDGGVPLSVPHGHSKDGAKTSHHKAL